MANRNHSSVKVRNRRGYQLRKAKRNPPKKKNPKSNYLEQQVQIAKLVSDLYAKNQWSGLKNIRERILKINYNVLDQMAEKNSIVAAIIQHRCRQINPFCKVAVNDYDRGFRILPRDTQFSNQAKANQRDKIKELENFFLNTGFGYDPDREDDLSDFVQYLVRDMLVIDQNTTELRRTRKGDVYDFWYVDPTTIDRAQKDQTELGKRVKYVQRIKEKNKTKVVATYTDDQMIFDYSNKRSRMKYRGYGYSLLEMAIDVITIFLFSQGYNKDLFVREKIPKGFLKVMGDVDAGALSAVRDAWVSEMSGYGGKFAVPVIPSGKDGVGIDWQSLGQSNRDMEYHKLMMLVMSLIGAVFGIDLAELGIKTDNSTALIGESGDARIQASKDAGLGFVTSYTEMYLNKILMKVDSDFVFRFVGVKDEDRKAVAEAHKVEIETSKTINDIKRERGEDPIDEPWANVVLNPQAVQIWQASQQQSMGGFGGEGDFSQFDETAPDEAGTEEEQPEETQKSLRKSKLPRKNKYFTIEI